MSSEKLGRSSVAPFYCGIFCNALDLEVFLSKEFALKPVRMCLKRSHLYTTEHLLCLPLVPDLL